MSNKAIVTQNAPAAVGPYSQAVKTGPWVFLSGQIALAPAGSTPPKLVSKDISDQTEQVLDNLQAVLEASGASFQDVVKVTIYLTDLADFSVVNALYQKRIGNPAPARATVEVSALPLGARVEMDAIALVGASEAAESSP